MPRTVHPPEWPDKVIFAALLQVMGGILGASFALLQLAWLRVDEEILRHVGIVDAGPALILSISTSLLGIYGIRHQASVWVWMAVATGVLSVGMLGLVPLLSFVAVGFLLRSRAEGQETKHDETILRPSLWPDKALAASVLLFVGGGVSLVQAYVIASDALLLPTVLHDAPMALAVVGVSAGLWSLCASFEVYRLRRAWTGYVSVGLLFTSLASMLIGPALAIATHFLMRKASAEREFEEGVPEAPGRRGGEAPSPS